MTVARGIGDMLRDARMALGGWLEQIRKRTSSGESTARRSSALTPLIWLCGIVVPACIYGAVQTNSAEVRVALIGLAALCIAALLVAYFLFLFRDPDRLHTEHHLVQMRALEVMAQKGGGGSVVMLDASVEMISDPNPRPVDKPEQLPLLLEKPPEPPPVSPPPARVPIKRGKKGDD